MRRPIPSAHAYTGGNGATPLSFFEPMQSSLMSSEETMDTEDELDGESTDGPWTLSAQRGILRCNNTRQRLESAIFNAVSLGQWELAQALFTTLAREDATGRENARELLKLLIMETSNFW